MRFGSMLSLSQTKLRPVPTLEHGEHGSDSVYRTRAMLHEALGCDPFQENTLFRLEIVL
jgi:hypothetical protein